MHPMAHATIAAAALDAKRLKKALERGDAAEAIVWLKHVTMKLESAIAIEARLERKETA